MGQQQRPNDVDENAGPEEHRAFLRASHLASIHHLLSEGTASKKSITSLILPSSEREHSRVSRCSAALLLYGVHRFSGFHSVIAEIR